MFDELRNACRPGMVGGFLPGMKQIANVAALPGEILFYLWHDLGKSFQQDLPILPGELYFNVRYCLLYLWSEGFCRA